MNERSIFVAALQRHNAADRSAFLDEACSDNAELREQVEMLLREHEQLGSFLESPARDPVATIGEPISERPGTLIGPYKLMEQIGEGGMGLVFVAEQQHPVRRKVAVKVIKPGMDTREVIARFEAERQALALMDHPNIARVFDAGATESGRPYFVMELVRGVGITQFCDENRLTPRERLELFVHVCQAVQHAHQKGIIHRDLKATNILVTLHDGRPVVKVIDFGVAKAIGQQLTDKTIYTRFAQMIGTPMYMSPEQAEMSGLDIDTRSDIYALGVLLYELLTGTTPFDRDRFKTATFDEIRRIVREEEPPRPSQRISTLLADVLTAVSAQRKADPKRLSQVFRGELDWIVMKALEKDRNRRYETANGFAADVQRYLDDEPVQACPASRWYRLRKVLRKHRGAAVTAAVFVGLLLAGAAVSTALAVWAVQAERDALAGWADAERKGEAATEARQKAVEDRIRAEKAEAEAKREVAKAEAVKTFLVQSVLGSASAWSSQADQGMMVKLLEGACRNLDHLFAAQPESEAAVRLTVGELYYSVELPAKAEPHLRRGLYLRRAARTAPLDPLKPKDAETLYAMKHLGTLLKDRGDLAEGEPFLRQSEEALRRAEIRRLPCLGSEPNLTYHMMSVAFSPDNRRVLAGGDGACLRLFEVATGTEVHRFVGHTHYIFAVAFSPDGRRVISGSADRTVRLWDVGTARELRKLEGHTGEVTSVVFSPDSRRALSGSDDKTIRLWDVETGAEVRRFQGHTAAVRQAVFTPDGRRVLSGSEDGTVRLWDVATGKEVRRFLERRTAVESVAVSPDGRRALSMDSGAVRLWNMDTGEEIRRFEGAAGWVAFAPDGHRALQTDHFHRKLRLWDVDTGKELKCLSVEMPLRPQKAVISPDGRLAACGNWRGSVSLWRLADPPPPDQELAEARQRLESARRDRGPENPDTLAALHDLGALLWDQGKPAEAEPLFRESLETKRRALGRDHPETLFALRELVALLQVQKKTARAEPLLHQYVEGARRALGPDHPDVLVALADLCVLLQDQGRLAEAEPLWRQRFEGWRRIHGPESSEWRGALRGLTAVLGRICVVRRFNGHTAAIHGVALPADRSRALTASLDGTLRRWNMQSGKEERCLKGHSGWVTSVALTADGSLALSGSYDQTVRLWDVDKAEEIRQFPGHTAPVESVALSPDGKLAVSGSQDKTVRVWEVDTGKELHCLTGHEHYARCVSFSPDGKQVLSGSFDKTMRLWSVETGKELRQFKGHTDAILCVAFSADGSHILSGSHDKTLRLWDAKTGEVVRQFEGHTGAIACLALSVDGRRAVSGGDDGTARVWDLETAKELYRFDGHEGGVWAVVFSADGDRVLSGCGAQDGTMLLWELPQDLRKAPLKK